ncbi:MAG: 4-(cytidine 5'-diphospho)-2-C-methyl-D-erythritol kinase [Terriglobales bacterium]
MPPTRFRARACAKINLGLKIVARRADGFHELRTVFQTISLADELSCELERGRGVRLETRGLPVPPGGDNLAYRAAEMVAEALKLRGRIVLRLHKRIPSGAGLGGGSSDAAAVIRMLSRAVARPPALATQLGWARRLGSDVPNFLLGGTVLGLGRGDEVYALEDLGPWHCVLAMPRAQMQGGLATPEAFARWDNDQRGRGLTGGGESATLTEFCSLVDQVLPAFRQERNRGPRGPKVHAGIENDFLRGVLSISPDFPRIHRQLRRASAVWVGLTGSGAAQFGLFRQSGPAADAAARLAVIHQSWLTRFVGRQQYARGLRAW